MRRFHLLILGGAALMTAARPVDAQVPPPPGGDAAAPGAPAQAGAEGEAEVYARGTLHEAFATPTSAEPVRNDPIDRQPPEAIDEVPPDQQPAGNNVTWIPGYWSYDVALDDFLWISGVWRDIPPGQQWVPGYWAEVEGGYQWIAGVWTSTETTQVTYLPQPPESQESGPSSPAPGDDYFYVPGSWEWHDDYRWRPGYWVPQRRDWVWVPACYYYTPAGYVHSHGYWDYTLPHRGLVFAPVYFHNHVHHRPYVPTVVINVNVGLHLWVHPHYHTYAYGDYYGPQYAEYGFTPWYDYQPYRGGHDHLFVHASWSRGPDFGRRLRQWNRFFDTNDNLRPAARARAQADVIAAAEASNNVNVVNATSLAINLNQAGDSNLPVNLREVSAEAKGRYRERATSVRKSQQARLQAETEASANAGADVKQPRQVQLDLPEPVETTPVEGVPQAPDQLANEKPESPDAQPDVADDRPGRGRDRTERPDSTDRPDATDPTPTDPTERPNATDRPGADRPAQDDRPRNRRRGDLPELPEGADVDVPDQPTERNPNVDRPRTNRPRPDATDRPTPQSDRPARPNAKPRNDRPDANPRPRSNRPDATPNRTDSNPNRTEAAPERPATPNIPDATPNRPRTREVPDAVPENPQPQTSRETRRPIGDAPGAGSSEPQPQPAPRGDNAGSRGNRGSAPVGGQEDKKERRRDRNP